MMYVAFFAVAVYAYLVGSINFSIIFSRRFDTDIRTKGSGNAGSTNMLRNYGIKIGIITLAADFLKALLVAFPVRLLFISFFSTYVKTAMAFAGLFCAIGHCYPVFFGFKGGKGVAVSAMSILMIDWRCFLIVVTAFLIQIIAFRYISLGSITGAAAFPASLAFFTDYSVTHEIVTLVLSTILAIMVIALHAPNIKRLVSGNESKFQFKK